MKFITKKANWLNEKDLKECFLIIGRLSLELVSNGFNEKSEEQRKNIFLNTSSDIIKTNEGFILDSEWPSLHSEIKDGEDRLKYKINILVKSKHLESSITHYSECGDRSIFNENSGFDKNFIYNCVININLIDLEKSSSMQDVKYRVVLNSIKESNTSCPELNYQGKDYGMASIFNLFKKN